MPYIRADTRRGTLSFVLRRPAPAAWEREFQLSRLGWVVMSPVPCSGLGEERGSGLLTDVVILLGGRELAL